SILIILVILTNHSRHSGNIVVVIQAHDANTLCVTSHCTNIIAMHADDLAVDGNHHKVIFIRYLLEGDELTRLRRDLHGNDALAASRLMAIIVDQTALTVSTLADSQHRRFM